MGLNGWFRGWIDPIVEFMHPVPPLALIPLVIIWFGIWETGKISLLFLAALWIMTIAASKFQQTDIVIMGIILIGIIGYGIDIIMRMAERWLAPGRARASYQVGVHFSVPVLICH